jgi:hypothetical protein
MNQNIPPLRGSLAARDDEKRLHHSQQCINNKKVLGCLFPHALMISLLRQPFVHDRVSTVTMDASNAYGTLQHFPGADGTDWDPRMLGIYCKFFWRGVRSRLLLLD